MQTPRRDGLHSPGPGHCADARDRLRPPSWRCPIRSPVGSPSQASVDFGYCAPPQPKHPRHVTGWRGSCRMIGLEEERYTRTALSDPAVLLADDVWLSVEARRPDPGGSGFSACVGFGRRRGCSRNLCARRRPCRIRERMYKGRRPVHPGDAEERGLDGTGGGSRGVPRGRDGERGGTEREGPR